MTRSLARPLSALAEEIVLEHTAAMAAASKALAHARRAGELLLEAKARVPHGSWGPWIEEHFPASARTARLYMSIAERWEELPASGENGNALPIRAAARLLSRPRETEVENGDRLVAEDDPIPSEASLQGSEVWRNWASGKMCLAIHGWDRLDMDSLKAVRWWFKRGYEALETYEKVAREHGRTQENEIIRDMLWGEVEAVAEVFERFLEVTT